MGEGRRRRGLYEGSVAQPPPPFPFLFRRLDLLSAAVVQAKAQVQTPGLLQGGGTPGQLGSLLGGANLLELVEAKAAVLRFQMRIREQLRRERGG